MTDDDISRQTPSRVEIVRASGADRLLGQIRPEWQDRSLIHRVNRLVTVDPSSACQRLFNAAIQDLRQKIIYAGLDIAHEAAERNKLPPVTRPEDILEEYSTARIIDLAYRMGLLSRPEWRRLTRCYEIRRDLEHEDDQYEAEAEDILYIFKTCIEVVLARDPAQLLRLADVEELVEATEAAAPSAEFLEEYSAAPAPRQRQIMEYLMNTALNSKTADIIRQNAIEALRTFSPLTHKQVKIELGEMTQARIGKDRLELVVAKVATAAGVLPYLKQRQTTQLFQWMAERFKSTSPHWTSHKDHGVLLDDLEDIGGLMNAPEEIRRSLVVWMTKCFIGEEGGYGEGRNRPVFYSDAASSRIRRLFHEAGPAIIRDLHSATKDPSIRRDLANAHIARRYELLQDIANRQVEE